MAPVLQTQAASLSLPQMKFKLFFTSAMVTWGISKHRWPHSIQRQLAQLATTSGEATTTGYTKCTPWCINFSVGHGYIQSDHPNPLVTVAMLCPGLLREIGSCPHGIAIMLEVRINFWSASMSPPGLMSTELLNRLMLFTCQ